jgi:hypothetical protein
VFDTLVKVGSAWNGERLFQMHMKELFQEVLDLGEFGRDTDELYGYFNEPKNYIFWHTLIGSIDNYTKGFDTLQRRIDKKTAGPTEFEKWYNWTISLSPEDLYDEEVRHVHSAINSTTVGRRFIVAENGHVGFAPESCEEGDLQVVLPGGRMPYVLRPQSSSNAENERQDDEGEEHYKILGDAYIHGVMDGEIFDILDEIGGEMEDIFLV